MARQPLATCSARGRRPQNEDAVLARALPGGGWALAVADGMGGHRAGDVASRTAVEAIDAALAASSPGAALRARLESAFAAAAERVAAAAQEEHREGMGTTLVLALAQGDELWVAHAGDSQAMLVVGDEVHALTRPHTAVEAELAARRITEAEALSHPFRHAVVRALGEGAVEPEVAPVDCALWQGAPGAVLLLGSDGLFNHLGAAEILELLSQSPDLDAGVRALVFRALENGSDDNASAAALELGSFPRRRAPRGRLAAVAVLAVLGAAALGGLIWVGGQLLAARAAEPASAIPPSPVESVPAASTPSPQPVSAATPSPPPAATAAAAGPLSREAAEQKALEERFQQKLEKDREAERLRQAAAAREAAARAAARARATPRPVPSPTAAPPSPHREPAPPRDGLSASAAAPVSMLPPANSGSGAASPARREGERAPGTTEPRLISSAKPDYPPALRQLRIAGRVVVKALVGENGRVLETRIERAEPPGRGFEDAARRAAGQFLFAPATEDGAPVRRWVSLPAFEFKP